MRFFLTLTIVSLLLTSCFKEDDKVVLDPPGQAIVSSVSIGTDYNNQVFFSLRNGDVLTNDFAAWDLAFESSPTGYHIWLNGGKGVLAALDGANYNYTNQSTADWKWDESSWNADSTAIGNWKQDVSRVPTPASSVLRTDDGNDMSRLVYLIDRGSNYETTDRYWKIIFQWCDENSYRIKYGKTDNTFNDSLVFNKDPKQAYTYFTFDNGGQNIVMEPHISTWDFVFTRYRHTFYYTTPPTPYSVNGVLLNPNDITATCDSITPYEQIDQAFAQQATLSSERNAIGYNWKYYDFTAQFYVVKPHFSYIIRDRQGYYWKLRFLDFYNSQGEKGYPKFEYQRL